MPLPRDALRTAFAMLALTSRKMPSAGLRSTEMPERLGDALADRGVRAVGVEPSSCPPQKCFGFR
jgi:hypothetical protein